MQVLPLPRLLMQVTGCMSVADHLLACHAMGLTTLLLHHVTALAALYKCVLCRGQGRRSLMGLHGGSFWRVIKIC